MFTITLKVRFGHITIIICTVHSAVHTIISFPNVFKLWTYNQGQRNSWRYC